MVGTVQLADSPQVPQSTKPVEVMFRHEGWFCGRAADGVTVAILRAPFPA